MKKILVALLVIGAVSIYVWDGYLVAKNIFGKFSDTTKQIEPVYAQISIQSLPVNRISEFKVMGKNPFMADSAKPVTQAFANAQLQKRAAMAATKTQPELPHITINSIMWNAKNPVAILNLPDGSTVIAKPGTDLGNGILVKSIEKSSVTCLMGKKSCVINR